MIWIILAALGVPLWLCALAILAILLRNRSLRRRGGDIPVHLRSAPDKRWARGHAVWTHDVLAFRGSPAAWKEALYGTRDVTLRPPTDDEHKHLHRIDDPIVARVELDGGESIEMAVAGAQRAHVLGPYATRAAA